MKFFIPLHRYAAIILLLTAICLLKNNFAMNPPVVCKEQKYVSTPSLHKQPEVWGGFGPFIALKRPPARHSVNPATINHPEYKASLVRKKSNKHIYK